MLSHILFLHLAASSITWVTAAGDLNINSKSDRNVPAAIRQLMVGSVRMANIEGAVSTGEQSNDFSIPPDWPEQLSGTLDVVSLVNNHSREFGESGLRQTQQLFSSVKIRTLSDDAPVLIEANGVRISIIARYLSDADAVPSPALLQSVRLLSRSTLVIVSLHWGIKNTVLPMPWQIKYARTLVDAGAHLIWGHGPHSIQGVEIYKNRPIAYSMGNLSFACDCTNETDSFVLRTGWSPRHQLKRVEIIPFHAGLEGQPPLIATQDIGLVKWLDTLNGALGTHFTQRHGKAFELSSDVSPHTGGIGRYQP